jgi:hypothetical protein
MIKATREVRMEGRARIVMIKISLERDYHLT